MPELDIAALLPSWVLTMKAERKSPGTIKTYVAGVRRFLSWCQETGTPPQLTKPIVTAYIADSLETCEATTAGGRLLALKRLSAWATDEGEQDTDPIAAIRQPKLDSKIIEPLTDEQLRALLKTCEGSKEFGDLRDLAILRFMIETTARANEVIGLQVGDVDLMAGTAIIRRGKGGKGRLVPFGPQTSLAMDRYRRARAKHKLAASTAWWLGVRSREFGYSALYLTLTQRAKAAGIERFHPHRLRHTAAHRWLAAGGSDSGLMAVAGWQQPQMLQRYTRARASERAAVEARTLNLGEL